MKNITTIEKTTIENTTTEQKSMKNIEVMKNITAMEKTAIEKTTTKKITAKITTTALLFFFTLFTLTTNLKAQAVQNSKSGFFAGFVYLQGFQVDSNKSISESTVTTSYEVTGYSERYL